MNKEKKKYNVTIFGDQYVLVSDDAPEYIMNVASRVDSLMQTISTSARLSDTKKIAVLAALQIAGKLIALEIEVKDKKVKHKELVNKIDQECLSVFSS